MYIKQTVLKSRIRFALLLRWSQISVITLKPQTTVYEEENINVSQNLDDSDGQTEISAIYSWFLPSWTDNLARLQALYDQVDDHMPLTP